LLDPSFAHKRTYWVQVEGVPGEDALEQLRRGVWIQGEKTRPAWAASMEEPALAPRVPPIRYRASIPTAWISLTLTEGRNRQVRRMTAAAGHPTLRLLRWSMENLSLEGLAPGQWRDLTSKELSELRRVCFPSRSGS
jgi:23S rRNA pseudouridine2457 synthase